VAYRYYTYSEHKKYERTVREDTNERMRKRQTRNNRRMMQKADLQAVIKNKVHTMTNAFINWNIFQCCLLLPEQSYEMLEVKVHI